jgi:hypothetical protein
MRRSPLKPTGNRPIIACVTTFQHGQRIRLVHRLFDLPAGTEGEVLGRSAGTVLVLFPGDTTLQVRPDEIEPVGGSDAVRSSGPRSAAA